MERVKKAVKGLFFDFDGVVTLDKQGTPLIVAYISKETGIPLDVVDGAYRKFNRDLLCGNVTHREMWGRFCADIGRDVSYDILERSFLNVNLDPKMIQYIRDRKGSYLIGMITDNKADRIDAIIEHTEIKGLFDVVIISANVRARKTERKIFEEALRQSGLEADECVFIDNAPENLKRPAEMGFTTIYFDDEKREYDKLVF